MKWAAVACMKELQDNNTHGDSPMTTSHDFDLMATSEMQALLDFVQLRMAVAVEDGAASQPEFERELRAHCLALERRVHVADFERLDVDAHGVVVDGVRYRRRAGKTPGQYMTLAGTISVERTTYRERGGHGGRTVAPLELRLGLVDGQWTLAAAEAGSAFMASVPSKEAAQLLRAAGSMAPSSSNLDRLPKRVSEVWEAGRETFEGVVRDLERLDLPDPARVALIAFGLDGILLPMKDAPRTPGLGKQDTGPKGHREVACASVSLYDAHGERLHTIRFGRMPEHHKVTLHAQLFAEVEAMRARYPMAKLQAIADGASENWRILGDIATRLGCEVTQTLDYFHAVQHLTVGLRAGGVEDNDLQEWRHTLRDAPDGLEQVIEELAVRLADIVRSGGPGHTATERELGYFMNQAGRMDYAAHAAANEPIGSGVVEAANKTLCADRMKRSGMSWLEAGGQAILTLRGQAQSGRLGHAWNVLRPAFVRRFEVDPNPRRQTPKLAAA